MFSNEIEADLKSFHALIRNRPKATNLNIALCKEEQTYHYIQGSGPVSGIYEFMTDSFKSAWHSNIVKNISLLNEVPVIQCKPPKAVFSSLGLKKGLIDIDIWVLDVEGAELEVLKGTNFDDVNINYICMECDQTNKVKDSEKVEFLNRAGFECTQVLRNCMCKNKNFIQSSIPIL